MKIKKVDDKPMVIHTKKKAKLHTHEPKKASIKASNIYTVDRSPKIKGSKITTTENKKFRRSTIHPVSKAKKGMFRQYRAAVKESKPKVLLLPEKSATTEKITEYLFGRGIDYSIIEYCIARGYIFESLPYHNLICVGFDEQGKARYAAYRATIDRRILGDCSGSDKHYSFRIADSKSDTVHLFECAVDLLSYATLAKISGRDWRQENLVSLAGVYLPKEKIEDSTTPAALVQYLKSKPHIKKIVLHLDNDNTGRKATEALKIILPDSYEVIDDPPPKGKDFNDFLCLKLGIYKSKERSFAR